MIRFYAPKDPFGFFSNFSRHRVTIYGDTWQTSEAPFQAMKFWPHRPDLVDRVLAAPNPTKAAELGRDRTKPIRSDWDTPLDPLFLGERLPGLAPVHVDDGVYRPGVKPEPVFSRGKDLFMYEVCYAKFTQHKDLLSSILSTGTEALIEDALHDPYWGWGASKVGQNKLGRILMLVRSNILGKVGRPSVLGG